MKTKKKVAKKEKKRKELNENLFQDLLFEHTKFESLNNEGWVNKWIKERKDWSFELNKEVTPRKQSQSQSAKDWFTVQTCNCTKKNKKFCLSKFGRWSTLAPQFQ